MLESTLFQNQPTANQNPFQATKIPGARKPESGGTQPPGNEKLDKPVFRVAYNPRTAGPIPAWTRNPTAQEESAYRLARANNEPAPKISAMAYAQQNHYAGSEPFSPGDFLDIVNPLQHLPVINKIYRGLTGDRIHPVSEIAGGTLFGGPAGAASSAVNVAVEYETGKDVMGNILAMLEDEPPAPIKTANAPERQMDIPKVAPTAGLQEEKLGALEGTTLAIANLKLPERNGDRPKTLLDGHQAPAGFHARKMNATDAHGYTRQREPVTTFGF